MERRKKRGSVLRLIGAIAVVVAMAVTVSGCGVGIQRGKVLFTKTAQTEPVNCSPGNTVTTVRATDPVYVTYVFKAKPGNETLTLSITKDGQPWSKSIDIPSSTTVGMDCIADTYSYSSIPGWGVGTYHFYIKNGDSIVSEGEIKSL